MGPVWANQPAASLAVTAARATAMAASGAARVHAPAVSTSVLILLPPRPERGPDSRPAGGPAGSRRPRPGHASGRARARRRRRPSPARAAAREEAPAPGRRRTPRRWCRPEPSSPGSSRPATTRRSAWSPAPGCAAPFPGRGCRGARGLSGGSSRCAYRTRRRRPAGLGRSAARRCATGRAVSPRSVAPTLVARAAGPAAADVPRESEPERGRRPAGW